VGRAVAVQPVRLLRSWPVRLLLIGVIAIIAIAVTAELDHRHTNAVYLPISDAPWYCLHGLGRCEEARHALSVEDRWHARETGYKTALVVIGAITVLLGAGAVYRDRARRTVA
jgi:hypothetical protein